MFLHILILLWNLGASTFNLLDTNGKKIKLNQLKYGSFKAEGELVLSLNFSINYLLLNFILYVLTFIEKLLFFSSSSKLIKLLINLIFKLVILVAY